MCVACAHDDMFSGFNTARKAAWLTQLEFASDLKDSQMVLHSIRESKNGDHNPFKLALVLITTKNCLAACQYEYSM